jgi:hypothetical protein
VFSRHIGTKLHAVLQCVCLQGRRFTADEICTELEMRDKCIEELEAKAAVHASELTHAHLERDWAKDEQRRAEDALTKSRTRKVCALGNMVQNFAMFPSCGFS